MIKVGRCRGVRLRKGSEGVVREGGNHVLYLRREEGSVRTACRMREG